MSQDLTTYTSGAQMPAWMNPENLDQALSLADKISKSGLMPDHLTNNPGGVLMVIDQAQRWNMSPLAVAQATSVVHGKLCYEGKLIHAALESVGAIRGPLCFDFDGPERSDKRSVTVTGILRNGEVRTVSGTVADWKTVSKNKAGVDISPWVKPSNYDKMLSYRGSREWARMHAPGAMLGVSTPDEAMEIRETSATVVDDKGAFRIPESQPKAEPKQEPKAETGHPALVAANELHAKIKAACEGRDVPTDARPGAVIARLSKLHGFQPGQDVPDELLEQFGKDVDSLLAVADDPIAVDDLLCSWEQANREG